MSDVARLVRLLEYIEKNGDSQDVLDGFDRCLAERDRLIARIEAGMVLAEASDANEAAEDEFKAVDYSAKSTHEALDIITAITNRLCDTLKQKKAAIAVFRALKGE
jgi:hypothetical protein